MVGILLLNTSYEPIFVISLQRAALLLLGGQALPIPGEPLAATLRSPSISLDVPTVLQLKRYINVPRRGAVWSRAGVFQRDGYYCIYCGAQPGDKQRGKILTKTDFDLEHLVPRSRGGSSTWGNTAVSCKFHNGLKRDRTPEEAHLKLLWEPKTPRTRYLVLRGELPSSWKKYVEF